VLPEGALTITLLSIGDVVSVKVLVGTIIRSRSLFIISAVITNKIFKLIFDIYIYMYIFLHSGTG